MLNQINCIQNACLKNRSILSMGCAVFLIGAVSAFGVNVPFTAQVISSNADFANTIFAADVDGDGDIDVLSASLFDSKIAWYENDGASPPTFTERMVSNSADGASSVYAADMDSDGDMDVLTAKGGKFRIAWYENDGATPPAFTERMISTSSDGAVSVFATDMDGDGDSDVLSASLADDTVAWYENDGGSPPAFTEQVISTTADGAMSVIASDVDDDGDIDVVSASTFDHMIAWYDNDGQSPPSFTTRVISTNAVEAGSVCTADVDSDGNTDILSASFGDDKVSWYKNDGGSPPSFIEHVISTTADTAYDVVATDVDEDGDIDVFYVSFGADKVAWFESDGGSPPSFTERVITTSADGALSVFATDVDGDGDTDVLSASSGDDKVAWYENRTLPKRGDLDGDGDVDWADFFLFQTAFTGPK